jgi:hypothetical protein
MTSVIRNSFLASVLANPRGSEINDDATYRRYKSNIRTSAVIGGNEDSRLSQVLYEVGRAVNTKGRALTRPMDGAILVEAGYPSSGALAEDFIGLAKKFTNFSANFEFTSLAGVVERLARGLAAQSVFENVTSTDLRAGRALTINALGTYDGPVSSLTNTVFIPRLVNSVMSGDVFSVLANAVAGEGSSVATDVVELDATTRQPIVAVVDSGAISQAIVEAIRILGANMIASDQGPLFALALTRGLHRVVSVVGHTDEGGITRDLLRCSGFAPPFGGIHYGLEPYAGIPAIATNNGVEQAAFVDALVLTTAALVAHCDPGQTYSGRWFPSFFMGTSKDDPTVRPGEEQEGTDAMAARNRAQLLSGVGGFADIYIRGLARLFAAEGNTGVATSFFVSACMQLGPNPRHLRYPTVTPWFWIEPTSLIPHDFLGSRAEEEGFASYGGRDAVRTKQAWEDIEPAGPGDTAFSGYHVVMRSARTAWFLLHWLNNPQNGLGAVSVRQLDPTAIIQPGPNAANPQVRDRVENGDPLSGFLWTRGQSPFPAPGEFMNISGTMGFMVKHVTFDDEGIPTLEHVPTSSEFVHSTVTITVGRPIGIVSGRSNNPGAEVRRAKTRAGRELAASTARARLYGRADVMEMPTLTSAPTIRSRAPPVAERLEREESRGGATGWGRGAAGGGERTGPQDREPTGTPLTPVPQHNPVRYPQVPRPAGNQPGGGGRAIPPNPPQGGSSGSDDDEPPAPVAIPAAGAAPPNGPAQQ